MPKAHVVYSSINQWVGEWVSEWVGGWVGRWVGGWVVESMCECVCAVSKLFAWYVIGPPTPLSSSPTHPPTYPPLPTHSLLPLPPSHGRVKKKEGGRGGGGVGGRVGGWVGRRGLMGGPLYSASCYKSSSGLYTQVGRWVGG